MAVNPMNNGTVIGNLTKNPKVLENKDGSKTVYVTVAARDNFKSGADKSYGTQFVQLKGFIRKDAEGLGVYGIMEKGAPWAFVYSVRTNSFADANGEMRYTQELTVESAQALESKTAAEARRERNAARVEVEGEEAGE